MVVIELFGGILPATAALHQCNISTISYFSEIASDPIEIASAHWPEATQIGDVRQLKKEWLDTVVAENPDALIWITGGVPCKDVSQLNKNRQGATGTHSGLYEVAAKLLDYLKSIHSRVAFTIECTRMDDNDRAKFSNAFGTEPVEINNRGWSPLSRPRWWWIGGVVPEWPRDTEHGLLNGIRRLRPRTPTVTWQQCLLPGYTPSSISNGESNVCFRCLTTRTPKEERPQEAAGLGEASEAAKQRWTQDLWSQAPYQYEDGNLVQDDQGNMRRLLPCEEEKLMGYPADYTAAIKKKAGEGHTAHAYRRQTLLGNSWSLFVTVFIVQSIIVPHIKAEELVGDSCMEHLDPEAYKWGRENCPYLHDLDEREMNSKALPPDWAEMHAHAASGLSERVQAKKHTPWHLKKGITGSGPIASLPKGLPPAVHFKAGCKAESPLDEQNDIPDDMNFAIMKTIALGSKADAWRRQQVKALQAWISHSQNLEEMWEELRSENSLEVVPNVRPHAWDLLSHSVKWPDVSVAAMMATGARPLGKQEFTGIFRQKETESTMDTEDFIGDSSAFMTTMKQRPPPSSSQARTIYDLSLKEQKAGLLSEWVSEDYLDKKYTRGKWRALPRYAIDQGGKWRLIDNGKAGKHNETYAADETIHTTCTSAGVSAASTFRRLMGKPLRKDEGLTISTQDMWKAYRQVPCHPDQLGFMIVMVWHPDHHKRVYAESKGLLFGLTGAVLAFNRVPALVVALARRWLAIPVQNFFDDFRILDIAKSGGSANKFFCILVQEVMGLKLDPAKEQKPHHEAVFLGNVKQYKVPYKVDHIRLAPKPGRKEAIKKFVAASLSERRLTPGEAKTLRGKMIHYASTCQGRVGKGVMHHINEQAQKEAADWCEGLEFNLLFMDELLTMDIPRTIPLSPDKIKKVRLWTGAGSTWTRRALQYVNFVASW